MSNRRSTASPQLKEGVMIMTIRNVPHPNKVNGKMFKGKAHNKTAALAASVDSGGQERKSFSLNQTEFQFLYHGNKVTRKLFPIRWALANPIQNEQGQTPNKLIVDFHSNFFHLDSFTLQNLASKSLLRLCSSTNNGILKQAQHPSTTCQGPYLTLFWESSYIS